jgi:hypothetical protein
MFSILQTLTATSTWDETEAALFIVGCIAKNVMP